MLYGTFDHTQVQKSKIDGSSKIERGSSVGEQFYTIDNTVKENSNFNNVMSRGADFGQPQPSRRQDYYCLEQPQVLGKQTGAHLKIKNLGLKIRAVGLESGSTGGLQRANTMGERMRSNSNNAR